MDFSVIMKNIQYLKENQRAVIDRPCIFYRICILKNILF